MNWRSLLSHAWPYRGPLSVCLVLMLAETAAGLAMPLLGGWIATSLLAAGGALEIDVLAPALIVLLAVQTALRIAQARMVTWTALQMGADLRRSLYDHLLRLPLAFFNARPHAQLLSMLTWETNVLTSFVTGTLLTLLPALLMLTGALAVMVAIDPLLAVPVAVAVPVFVIVLRLVARSLRPLSGRIRDAYADGLTHEETTLAMAPVLKSFTRESLEQRLHDRHVGRYRDLSVALERIEAALGPLMTFAASAAVIAVIWMASAEVRDGSMTPGELVAFLLYAALLTRPVSTLGGVWAQYQTARGVLGHMEEVLGEVTERAGGRRLRTVRGALTAEDLHFSFPGRPPVLRGVAFDIAPGSMVAIIGPNGAGKSTLVELLMRFHEPQAGRIRLDGVDIAELDLACLRRAIAYLPQEPVLIDGSIEDNVRYGRPEATAAEIAWALRHAQAEAFVQELPEGLATQIGERGVKLSGGQRQRIALARALVKDPAILILDEPTAMFDPASEAAFVRDARGALRDRTVILITHRPASLKLADRVLALEDGRLAERDAAA